MFASTRIIAIDDDERHLIGLANSLNRQGAACLQLHFSGDLGAVKPCPDVRIVFSDLHLGLGNLSDSDYTRDFAAIAGLLADTIKPVGPYFIVLWTKYSAEAPALLAFLHERLQDEVPRPFNVLPLRKQDHLDSDGRVADETALIESIKAVIQKVPAIGALLDWEGRVLDAAGDTVASLVGLAGQPIDEGSNEEVGRILARLGVAAVGEKNVNADRFRAVNDALLPILADRIANLPSDSADASLWRSALKVGGSDDLSIDKAAMLNRLVHVADVGNGNTTERGAVIELPQCYRNDFMRWFGIDEAKAARLYRCDGFVANDERFKWVLVQCQAACDYAQTRPGPLPFYLGLDFPQENRQPDTPPASLWPAPWFELGGMVHCLHVNGLFPVPMPLSVVQSGRFCYRLREQALSELIYRIHSHGARPGMMSFRGK